MRPVRLANDTPFGLAAYFYSRDLARVWRVADRLETGIVGINEGALAAEAAPFGGVKESGYGREGSRHGWRTTCTSSTCAREACGEQSVQEGAGPAAGADRPVAVRWPIPYLAEVSATAGFDCC
jgi:hypothetical protein